MCGRAVVGISARIGSWCHTAVLLSATRALPCTAVTSLTDHKSFCFWPVQKAKLHVNFSENVRNHRCGKNDNNNNNYAVILTDCFAIKKFLLFSMFKQIRILHWLGHHLHTVRYRPNADGQLFCMDRPVSLVWLVSVVLGGTKARHILQMAAKRAWSEWLLRCCRV